MAQASIRKQAAPCPPAGKAVAAAGRATARGPTDPQDIASNLYRATLDLLRWSDDPSGERHFLLAPLSAAVASQRTRDGILWCEALNAALATCDYDAALDACIALVDLTVARAGKPQPDAPGWLDSADPDG